eukprot:TRINITY_DN1553_c2_g2_i15.p1 TRINITY_DN1553_c2_g2~~TRINITY_DN1553_c2_g2_i15.p1  ORF type:complete len:207 (+),score=59.88 TRINITY_DN1553_c2_g2_i15:414-1034(+)
MADIITSQIDWNGNKCYEFWKLDPCCGAPDILNAAKCCVWWWFCGCFPSCQLWGTQLGAPQCSVVNHCFIPWLVPCVLYSIAWLLPAGLWMLPYWAAHVLLAPTLRYNIRQKKGIPAAGPCNGWLGDCICHTCAFCLCFMPVCQELRAVEVEEWDCISWFQGKPPTLIDAPVTVENTWYSGGVPCQQGAGGGAGGGAQPGYQAYKG